MNEDAELLGRYACERSESAFTELIRRHVDLVYSAAVRLAGRDTHRAQDVTQQVFCELARQAQRLRKHPALDGWLYTTTRLVALRAHRTEQRRKAREQEANAMDELLRNPAPEPAWDDLLPVLDEAMHKLGEKDRVAVLLRYFKNKSLKEVGTLLGLSENAARMRVERALEKLRSQLARKGVTSTATALAVTLTGNAATAAPTAFVATLTSGSIASAAAASGTALTLLKFMTATKFKAGIIATIAAAGVATTLVIQHETQARIRAADASLGQQADQLARLQAANERLSNLTAAASRPALNSQDELQTLRDEVAGLRKQASDLAALREEDRQLQAALNRARTKFREDLHGPKDQQTAESPELNARTDYCMRLGGAMKMYARQHGQFPTNLAQVAGIMSGEYGNRTNFTGFTPDQFEIVFQGLPPAPDKYAPPDKYAHPNDIIWIREKRPWRNADGKWVKVYTMVGGIGMVHSEVDGNFTAWENRRIVLPEASK